MWEKLLWVDSLPAMNWISSISSRSATRYLARKSSVLPARMAAIELVGELLARHIHDDEVGVGPLDLDLDGGEQVGLAQA